MGFIYSLFYKYNTILLGTSNQQSINGDSKQSQLTVSRDSEHLTLSSLKFAQSVFNIQNYSIVNFTRFSHVRIAILKFVILNFPVFFFYTLSCNDKAAVPAKSSFLKFKSCYRVFFLSNSCKLESSKLYYYYYFFNRFFFTNLNFFFFKLVNSTNTSVVSIEQFFFLKFFVNFGSQRHLKFINASNPRSYFRALSTYNIATDSVLSPFTTNDKLSSAVVSTPSKKLNRLPTLAKSKLAHSTINIADVFCFSQLLNAENSMVSTKNIFFLKLNKLYNKGRYARNKQIYRTGVIWSLWLTVLFIAGPFYYFYSFTFNFTYAWFLFFFFIFRFIFVYASKYNYVSSWKFFVFLKKIFL